jgi:DNA primase
MRIPRHKVDEIYQRADIVEVVSDYVQLKKKGSYYVGLSPFKHERTPSFTVTPSKGIFKDFSTGKGGNVVTFLMEMEGYSYQEALLQLAQRYQIEIEPDLSPESKAQDQKRESLRILNKFACDYFHQNLIRNPDNPARNYLHQRGFTDETIKTFQIGYCLPEWEAFTQTALRNQYRAEHLIETGLSILSEKNGKLFDRFHGRVMFPIHDSGGKIVGFSGRLLEPKENTGKYVNSPESSIYIKGKLLFGLYFAKNAIREQEEAILVEGNLDMISLYQAGIKNVVASGGTALTEDQITLIKRYAKRVLLLFDGDPAGISASVRAIDLLLAQDLAVKVLLLPEGHDPDSYLKAYGVSDFHAFAEKNATDAISFKINVLKEKYNVDDPTQKGFLIGEIGQTIAKINDEVQRALFVQVAAERLRISEQLMLSATNKSFQESALAQQKKWEAEQKRLHADAFPEEPDFTDYGASVPRTAKAEKQAVDSLLTQSTGYAKELELLRLMLNYPHRTLYEWIDDDLPDDEVLMMDFIYNDIGEVPFKHPVLEVIRVKLMDAHRHNLPLPIDELLHECGAEVRQIVSELMTEKYSISERWSERDIAVPKPDYDLFESVNQSLLHFKLEKLNEFLRENSRMLRDAQNRTDIGFDMIELLIKRKMKIEAKRKKITEELGIVVL